MRKLNGGGEFHSLVEVPIATLIGISIHLSLFIDLSIYLSFFGMIYQPIYLRIIIYHYLS